MNIIAPPRIDSLESKTIRVIEHTGTAKATAPWTFQAYPFDSILFVKQQIALHYNARGYLPNHLFIAEKTTTGTYRPLEFRWPFTAALADPLDATVWGKPSTDLMEGDVRKPVFPTLLAGVTLESMSLNTTANEIHVWSLATVLEANAQSLDVSPTVVAGFLQLYFPMLETPADAEAVLGPLTAAETQSLEAIRLFQEQRGARLTKLEGFLKSLQGPVPQLHDLRALRILLPSQPLGESLDILFHTMTPTKALPILRYFAANQRTPPLLKLALNPAGIPLLADAKLLRTLLGDAPAAEQGAMIVGKAPILHPKAPYGTAWVLRIYEDGSGEIVLGAPRRDAPLTRDVVAEAFQQLRGCLAVSPWKDSAIVTAGDFSATRLEELTATYKYTLQQDIRKPTKLELRKRGEPFAPLFKEEAPLTGEAALGLRWKAVSNFAPERDPVMSYISDLFLKEASLSVEKIPVGAYVAAITREFGLGPVEAGQALSTWINRHAEYVLVDADAPEKAVAKHGIGAAVTLYNHHPDYLFGVAGVSGFVDLQRILSMLEIWVSHTAADLKMEGPALTAIEEELPVGPPAPLVPAPLAAPEEEEATNYGQMDDWFQAMEMYGQMGEEDVGDVGDVGNLGIAHQDETTTAIQDAQPLPAEPTQVLALEKDVRYPDPIGADEAPLPPLDKFLITRLQAHDSDLFSYKTEQSTKLFSRTCQSSSNKQPNVMSPEAYRRVRSLYGDSVHWVEAPLSKYDTTAIYFTSKVLGERMKEAKTQKKSLQDVLDYEKRILSLGIPLKDGLSVVSKWKDAPVGAREEVETLQTFQKSKPLWLVVRAGTAKANYYICAEWWCIRDDLPLIDAEFTGKVSRRGLTKPANTCPFCGGKEIPKDQTPKAGETVMRRGTTTKSATGVVARFAGFGSELFHPKGFVVPCCFTDPGSLIPPTEAAPFPTPIVELPAIQQTGPKTPAEKEEAVVELVQTRNLMDVFTEARIKLDYKAADFVGITEDTYRFLDKEKTKVELKAKAIVRAYILAASSFPLELGKVGLVPEAVDAFLGQDAKQYLESPKHGKIYTHPKLRGHAFFRLGLGTRVRNVGNMLLQLVAYARAVVSHIVPPYQTAALTPEQVYQELFETQEVLTFHAFQQANYGTLPAEFADPESRPTPGELQTWCGRMGIPLPAQRAQAEFLYGAWHRFKTYVADQSQRKELRLWEHLFTAPGLFTATGVVLATLTTDVNDHVILRCPALGVSLRHQAVRPPLLLLWEDRRTRIVEPLMFYEGPDQLLGVLDPESVAFGQLSPALREPLAAFYADFFDPRVGCGRPQAVSYPWLEDDAPQTGIPRLGALLAVLRKQENVTLDYLLRDRTRRLVGVVVRYGDSALFVPAVDDGTVDVALVSRYDVEALPLSPLVPLLNFLVGAAATAENATGLIRFFGGLLPMELRSQPRSVGKTEATMLVALETRCGAIIPLEPIKQDAVISHPMYTQFRGSVQIDELPWLSGMSHAEEDATAISSNPEELLEESYQHVRLSLGAWLNTAAGKPYKKAIEDLRAKRAQLPLYELRKRMDLLLGPVVAKWLHVGDKGTVWDISTLRRNCLRLPRGQCDGACAWSTDEDTCLIHTVATERFADPVFVITARLADELMRTYEPAQQILTGSVARLRPPVGVVRERDTLLLSFEGRGDAGVWQALGLEGRLPTRYTQGLVIPEELGAENVGCEASRQGIPLTWEGITHMVWPAAATGQNLRAIAWAAILGTTAWSDAERILQSEGEMAFYRHVASNNGISVLFTRDTCHGYELVGRLVTKVTKNAKDNGLQDGLYVILTPDRLPLASEKTKQPMLRESELPSVVLSWLDESPKEVTKGIIADVLEEEEPATEPTQPFAEIEEEERRVLEMQKRQEKAPVAEKKPAAKKPCPEDQERSAISGKCVKKCAPGEIRSEKGHCKKAPKKPQQPQQPRISIQEIQEEEQELLAPAPAPVPALQPTNTLNISKYDLKRCPTSKGQASAFPFKKDEIWAALKEQGVKALKKWHMAELCSHVNEATLRILVRRKANATRKNRNQPQQPLQEPLQQLQQPQPQATNMPAYKIEKCATSKGQAATFPFKKDEIWAALKEQGVKALKKWHMAELCSHVNEATLRILHKNRLAEGALKGGVAAVG